MHKETIPTHGITGPNSSVKPPKRKEGSVSMAILQSPRNPWICELRRLWTHSNFRRQRLFPIEGPKLIEEAGKAGIIMDTVLTTPRFEASSQHSALLANLRQTAGTYRLAEEQVLQSISNAEQHQGILALAQRPKTQSLEQLFSLPQFVLVLVDMQDPGNCGALARSHLAFGGRLLVTIGSTADPLSSKALRASAGAVLHLSLAHFRTFPEFHSHNLFSRLPLLAALPRGGRHPESLSAKIPAALLMGNESRGLPVEVLQICAEKISLPMADITESLNAAVAGSLLLYELGRYYHLGPFREHHEASSRPF